jgi:hypothetical protein
MYVDDILAVSHCPMPMMEEIQRMVKFKNDKIEEPSNYLGAKLQRKEINGVTSWTITSPDYVKAAIENVEEGIRDKRWKLPTKVTTPMTNSYVPELDGSPELDADDTQYFQELIGMLRWATELGRVDILFEVSLLSHCQASPREGHIEQIFHIFAFLRKKPKLSIYLDPSLPHIEYRDFKTNKEDFAEQYRGAKRANAPRHAQAKGTSSHYHRICRCLTCCQQEDQEVSHWLPALSTELPSCGIASANKPSNPAPSRLSSLPCEQE